MVKMLKVVGDWAATFLSIILTDILKLHWGVGRTRADISYPRYIFNATRYYFQPNKFVFRNLNEWNEGISEKLIRILT